MRAAIYARVSTTDKGQNPEVQLSELREYVEHREWKLVASFTDYVSGAKDKRPGLDQLWELCRRRKVDAVVVYRFDRFARSMKQLVFALAEFDALGVQFVSIREAVDTTTPGGRFTFHIFAAIAEFERELTRERVRSGIAHARSKGHRWGRHRAVVDVAQIRALRAQGRSWAAIGREVGTSRSSVVRALKRATDENPV